MELSDSRLLPAGFARHREDPVRPLVKQIVPMRAALSGRFVALDEMVAPAVAEEQIGLSASIRAMAQVPRDAFSDRLSSDTVSGAQRRSRFLDEARGEDRWHVKIRKNEELLGLPTVRVLSSSGAMLGVMEPAEALRMARDEGLDLVEVNPRAEPPVCKLLDLARYTYDAAKKAAQRSRGGEPVVFLVRSKTVVQRRPGTFLIGELVTGDAIRAGMVARIPHGHDAIHAVPILSVEFVDHRAEKTSELALHVHGESPEQVAAVEALEGAHLIEVIDP